MTLSRRIQRPTRSPLGVIPGALDSETKAFAIQKSDLDEEKATLIAAQVEADVPGQSET
jgi:hypothetical protein